VNGSPSIDRKGETLVFLREDSVTPREVWATRLAIPSGSRGAKGRAAAPAGPKSLTDTNPQVRDRLSFPKEIVTWKGASGWDMEGLLVYPQGYVKGTRVPLALNVHGGPAGTHSNAFTPAARLWGWPLFAQRGYALFFPNPRGSGGYGETFRAANVRDWGVADYEDLMKGVDALVERGIADADRLTVNGWSYGGFMTSTIVTKTTGSSRLSWAPRSRTWPRSPAPPTSRVRPVVLPVLALGGPKVYVERSALFHAGNVKTPSLVVHGDKDERVPFSQGWEFYNALKVVGVPTDLLVLPASPTASASRSS